MGRKNQNKYFKMNRCNNTFKKRYSTKSDDLFLNCNLKTKFKNVLHYASEEETVETSNLPATHHEYVTFGPRAQRYRKARIRRLKKLLPELDSKTGSPLITLLISVAMKDGRINPARKVIYKTHERLQKILSKKDVLFLWELAFRKISPGVRRYITYGTGRGNISGLNRNIDYGRKNYKNLNRVNLGGRGKGKNKKKHPRTWALGMSVKASLRVAAKWLIEVARQKGRFSSAEDKLSDEILALTTTKRSRPRTIGKLKRYYRDLWWGIGLMLKKKHKKFYNKKKLPKLPLRRKDTNTHYSPDAPKLKNTKELKSRSKYTL